MGYRGGEIASLFKEEPLQRAGKRIAKEVLKEFQTLTVRNTPIGGVYAPGMGGGNLRSSWHTEGPVYSTSFLGREWRGAVSTEVDYAPYVEYGTGLYGPKHAKYLIKPKTPGGTLSWIDPVTRKRRFAKYVWHPGSPGAHMLLNAAVKTEVMFEAIAEPILQEWAREAERLAD